MSRWEQARHNTLEAGVDLLKRLVNMQADLLKAAIGAGGAGADLPRLAGQYPHACERFLWHMPQYPRETG